MGEQPPAPQPDIGTLIPPEQVSAARPQAPAMEDTTRAVMSQIGDMHTQVEDLARQFPPAAAKAREVGRLLVEMGMDIVRSLSGPGSEPPAPSVLG